MKDPIERQDAIDALWKALYEYEDKTEKQFQESEDLDVGDWIEHRIFVQNMSDIDRKTILDLPSAQPNIARDIATIIENEKDMRVLLNAQPRMKGEWIDSETSYADGVRQSCNCSICGKRSIRPLGDFCRWCGADMRGEEDDEKT